MHRQAGKIASCILPQHLWLSGGLINQQAVVIGELQQQVARG